MNCDCSIDPSDFDRPECFSERWRKARKRHECCECGGEIKTGTRYEYTSGIWDGRPDSHKTCETCVRIREEYCPHGWVYEELACQIFDCLGFDYREVPEEEE